jgi:hypothetical protein|tara:strand:- start:4513 stop:5073 length:561 start_codon:yes stop_codon:yes gene_type:complete
MAIANSYPLGTPKLEDLLLGTSVPKAGTNHKPKTRNFSVSDVIALATGTLLQAKKVTITTDQLKISGNSVVNIVDLEENQVADVISVMVRVNNQSAANKLTFADPLTIEPQGQVVPNYKYIIPVSVANSEVVGQFYKPALDAGYSDIGPVIGDVRFKNSVTDSNPVETGTATTTLDIYITYRIIAV